VRADLRPLGRSLGIRATAVAPYFTEDVVAVAVMLIVFPLTMVKNFSFFARFTSLGACGAPTQAHTHAKARRLPR
jgi:hypothetical protein